ncbi:MAG: hypothetical protein AAF617_15955 [Bacteroidota bacterium]
MKKRNLILKLELKKKTIVSFNALHIKGGMFGANAETTVDDSLGKQSTCPIETCTCTDAINANCNPVRM